MNQLGVGLRVQILHCLLEGNSINSTCRLTGAAKNTVLKLLCDAGKACYDYHDKTLRNLACKRIECDEIWSFCGSKKKNVTPETSAKGWGDVWTWTAMDSDTKLMVAWYVGNRDAASAYHFMHDLKSRLANRVQLSTDGLRIYLEAVEDAFGAEIDFGRLVKIYGNYIGPGTENPEIRYSQPPCTGIRKEIITGKPERRHISTSFVERQNLNMRMSMRRFTRLTNAFSKKVENHKHAISIYFLFYNFCRIHGSLRVTPAMEAGVADHVWEIEEIVSLIKPSSVQKPK